MSDSKARAEAISTLAGLIRDIPVAMLTTTCEDKSLHSRPMININREFRGDLWFFTPAADPKVTEMKANPHVNVCFSDPSNHQYVSVAGVAKVMKDQKRAELLWTDECDAWFPSGVKAGDLAIIQIDVESAQYWDAKESAMVAVGGLVRRMFTGDPTRPVEHETVDWLKDS